MAASLPALVAQISTHIRRVKQLQAKRNCQYQCTEMRKTVSMPNGVWVKVQCCEDPVMYVHPAADTVPVLEAVEEAVVVTKTRPMNNGTLHAVGGGINWDPYLVFSSVGLYDEDKNQWEAVASMDSARCGAGVAVIPPSFAVPTGLCMGEALSLD